MTDSADGAAFQRSRQHRRGVRRASISLEEALARPVGHEAGHWFTNVAVQVRALAEAFRHHAEQSEGPARRQRGSDLIYEAYYVDVEGGE